MNLTDSCPLENLIRCRQLEGELASAFIRRLNSHYLNCNLYLTESQKISSMVGLLNDRYRSKIYRNSINSLPELFTILRNLELVFIDNDRQVAEASSLPPFNPFLAGDFPSDLITNHDEPRLPTAAPNNERPIYKLVNPSTKWVNGRTCRCYVCHGLGHRSFECRHRKKR